MGVLAGDARSLDNGSDEPEGGSGKIALLGALSPRLCQVRGEPWDVARV